MATTNSGRIGAGVVLPPPEGSPLPVDWEPAPGVEPPPQAVSKAAEMARAKTFRILFIAGLRYRSTERASDQMMLESGAVTSCDTKGTA